MGITSSLYMQYQFVVVVVQKMDPVVQKAGYAIRRRPLLRGRQSPGRNMVQTKFAQSQPICVAARRVQ